MIRFMFCCNDYRNGMFQGWFDAVHIEREEIEMEGPRTRIAQLPEGRVRIGRCIYDHKGWAEWVGNWCWDEIAIVDHKKLLRQLRKRGFSCLAGPSEFYDKWNARVEP